MDIRLLRTFVAVADQGSFAAAANAVGLSPSGVSMQIQALEDYLGAEVFNRARRPPVLNDKGLSIVATARKMVLLHDSLRDEAAITPGEFTGRLRLGVIPTALSSFVPSVLAGLNAAHPLIEVEVVTGMNTGLFQLLKNGEIDAAIIGEPPRLPAALRWRHIADEPICVIAHHAVPEETATSLLKRYPYIKLVRGAWQLRLIDEQVDKASLKLNILMQLDSIEAVALMVRHGLGVSIVPRRIIEPLLTFPLKWVGFGKPQLQRKLGLVYHHGSTKLQLIEALHEEILRTCASQQQPKARGSRTQSSREIKQISHTRASRGK